MGAHQHVAEGQQRKDEKVRRLSTVSKWKTLLQRFEYGDEKTIYIYIRAAKIYDDFGIKSLLAYTCHRNANERSEL
jgi:hypothetical protein